MALEHSMHFLYQGLKEINNAIFNCVAFMMPEFMYFERETTDIELAFIIDSNRCGNQLIC